MQGIYALAALLLFSLFFILFLIGAITSKESEWRQSVIDRGYGMYCPTTGEFAWKGECE